METAIQPRRNPAAMSPARVNRAAYGPFCDALWRCGVLTPTARSVGRLLAWATLRQGVTSLAYSSLSELTQYRRDARPFAGLGKNDLSPALSSLKSYGVVRLEERAALESGVPPVTVLLVIADSLQWAVPADGWLYSEAEERELQMHLLACRQRWTAQLPELSEGADLHDARAALAAESAARNAPKLTGGTKIAACRDVSFTSQPPDAPEDRITGQSRPAAPHRSESRNANTPAKPPCVPTFRTPISIESETEIGSKTLPIEIAAPRPDEIKLAIAEAQEKEFCTAARLVLGPRDWDDGRPVTWTGDGGKWRCRFRDDKSRRTVRSVFLDMIESNQTGGAAAEFRWQQFGGRALDEARLKIFKESFLSR